MKRHAYRSMESRLSLDRRDFFRVGGAAGAVAGIGLLAGRSLAAVQEQAPASPAKPATNIADAMKVPRTKFSLPGPFPGRVVEVRDAASVSGAKVDAAAVRAMFEKGITALTGKDLASTPFGLFFTKDDVVGVKINPVGPGLISTRLEVVDAIVGWLAANGLPRQNIVVWDRFFWLFTSLDFSTHYTAYIAYRPTKRLDYITVRWGFYSDNRGCLWPCT